MNGVVLANFLLNLSDESKSNKVDFILCAVRVRENIHKAPGMQ